MAYLIVEKDHIKKTHKVILDGLGLAEAVNECESIALDFVIKHEGEKYKLKKPYFYDRSPSRKWGKIDRDGYFITKDANGFIRYTIYKKQWEQGIMMSYSDVKKICVYEVIKKPVSNKTEYIEFDLNTARSSIKALAHVCSEIKEKVDQYPEKQNKEYSFYKNAEPVTSGSDEQN